MKPSEILRGGAQLIRESPRLARGVLVTNWAGKECYCAMGAMNKFAFGTPFNASLSEGGYVDADVARFRLQATITDRTRGSFGSIAAWNDSGVRKSQVAAMMDRAALESEAWGQ